MELKHILATIIFCSLSSANAVETTATSSAQSQTQSAIGQKKNKIKAKKQTSAKAANKAQTKNTALGNAKTSAAQANTTDPMTTAANQSTTQAAAKKETKLFGFGFGLSSSYNTQAEKQTDGSRSEYISHVLMPSMRIAEYSIAGTFIYNDDIKDPGSNEWQDSSIAIGRKAWSLGEYLKLSPTVAVAIPLSKATREDIRLKYALVGGLGLGLNSKAVGAENLVLSYSVSYTKMYTEFETKASGEPLSSYRIRQTLNLGYQILDSLSFMTISRFDSSYSYANVVRNGFQAIQALEYKITDHISTYIAHANGGAAFLVKENATDYYLENNVKLYDPKSSEISIGLNLSI